VLKLFRFFLILVTFVFFGFFGQGSKQNQEKNRNKVSVKVSQNKLETGQVFSYLITIEGDFNDPELIIPSLDDFMVISTKKTESFSYQKDNIKTKIKITYFLVCPKPGTFKIEPVKIIDAGKTYQSDSLTIVATGDPLEKKKKLQPYIEDGIEI
jgi:hypothetical protein